MTAGELLLVVVLLQAFYIQDTQPATTSECLTALGLEKHGITDPQMTASSVWNANHGAANGRLNFNAGGGKTGAWSARYNNAQQWLQVDFGLTTKITRIATQGRQDANQWVKSYTLAYSRDGTVWETYLKKMFDGNNNRNTMVFHDISPAIIARFVRIQPKTWQSHISLRAEFYGCTSGFCIPKEKCASALGMIDGRIPDSRITASTSYNANLLPARARLHLRRQGRLLGSWAARVNDGGQFLQVDLGKVTKITRIATQGRQDANQWVTTYRLRFSQDGGYYEPYTNNKVLTGNKDRDRVAVNILAPVIIARYIRVLPKTWYGHISMRMELYGCKEGFQTPKIPKCQSKLTMADDQMSASSEWNSGHRAANARLHFYAGGGRTGAWSALVNNVYQFLEIDFGKVTQITLVSTQGRQDASQWVKSYTLEYSMDGGIFKSYSVGGKIKILTGNSDRYTVVSHVLANPIITRYIRVRPKTWQGHISMRLEFYGCYKGFTPPNVPKCVSPMGLRSGLVKDTKMSASSEWNSGHRAANARLYFHAGRGRTGAWSARVNNNKQWLQVDFSQVVKIKRVATQGRQDANQWVKSYSLQFSRDGIFWEDYQQGKYVAVLSGNTDRFIVILHELQTAIIARFIRILPKTWQSHISLRAEFFGCRKGFVIPPVECAAALGMQNKKIPDARLTASSIWSATHSPARARLHLPRQGSLMGAWSARFNDHGQWLQVDMTQITKVTRIATQGRQDANQWITSYSLQFSMDGGHFEPYINSKILKGNNNRNTVVGHILKPAIIAKFIRVVPRTWYGHISMRLELYGCTEGFQVPIIKKCLAAINLADNQMSASSEYNAAHRAANARLHFMAGGGRTGSWSARTNDAFQFLEVHFNKATKVTRMSTQGRQDANQWVKSYTLEYSLDGSLFTPYSVKGNVKVFTGNNDRHNVVTHVLPNPIITRYIRVRPKTWQGHISMRVQFYGCTEGFEPPPKPECVTALGCQCLSIKDHQFSASSEYNAALKAANARLHLNARKDIGGGWAAKLNNVNQWIQVDFEDYKTVTRIATQGRQETNQWVTSYMVQYSMDGKKFITYANNGKDRVFLGNRDRGSVVLNEFVPPLKNIRFIRVLPKTWYGHIAMRMELYGCEGGIPQQMAPCSKALDLGIILDRSGSVGATNFKKVKAFLSTLVTRLGISTSGSRLGIIAYSSTATRIVSFASVASQSLPAMKTVIDGIPFTAGGTRTDMALRLANSDLFSPSGGDRRDIPDVLIVMTDGKTNAGSAPYPTVLKPLLAKNVDVIAIGIGSGINKAELLQIANKKQNKVIQVDNFDALSTQLNAILAMSCKPK